MGGLATQGRGNERQRETNADHDRVHGSIPGRRKLRTVPINDMDVVSLAAAYGPPHQRNLEGAAERMRLPQNEPRRLHIGLSLFAQPHLNSTCGTQDSAFAKARCRGLRSAKTTDNPKTRQQVGQQGECIRRSP